MNGFNAFKYVEDLREAGVPDKQAEAHLRVLHDIIESNLATKRDIKEVKRDIKEVKRDIEEVKREIQELKNELKRDIKELEQKMTIKLGALIVVTIGILVALSNLQII